MRHRNNLNALGYPVHKGKRVAPREHEPPAAVLVLRPDLGPSQDLFNGVVESEKKTAGGERAPQGIPIASVLRFD